MGLDGYHLTHSQGRVGAHASASSIERSSPVVPRERNAWKYHESIPDSARIDRHFFGYDDIEELSTWDHAEIKRQYDQYGWRSRLDNTTKRREFYLWDLVATSWSYMGEWRGTTYDPALLIDAKDYLRNTLSLGESSWTKTAAAL